MNKSISTILVVSLLVAGTSEGKVESANLSFEQKQDVAQAIQFLVESGVIKKDSKMSVKVDSDIINQLQSEGLLSIGSSRAQVICAGQER